MGMRLFSGWLSNFQGDEIIFWGEGGGLSFSR